MAISEGSYLGGASGDSGAAIAVNGSGEAFVVEYTESEDFPLAAALPYQGGGIKDFFFSGISPLSPTPTAAVTATPAPTATAQATPEPWQAASSRATSTQPAGDPAANGADRPLPAGGSSCLGSLFGLVFVFGLAAGQRRLFGLP